MYSSHANLPASIHEQYLPHASYIEESEADIECNLVRLICVARTMKLWLLHVHVWISGLMTIMKPPLQAAFGGL
jgi:hypothetical protein